ncbi:MAG: peptidylprolyl isomerase [Candidatus Nealsonbacteria bacterium]
MGKIKKIKEQRRLEREEESFKKKKRSKKALFVVLALVFLAAAVFGWKVLSPEEIKLAVLETNYGTVKIRMFPELSPKTVANFETLASDNYYDGIKFHRVIQDFMIQTGDPNSRDQDWSDDGIGGPGYDFEDEINDLKMIKGKVAMANSGPDTNGSQFFILTADSATWLDGKHTVFGEVFEGMDVVLKIEKAETNENDHPIEDIIMERVYFEKAKI